MKVQVGYFFSACILLLSCGVQNEKQMSKSELDISKHLQVIDTAKSLPPKPSDEYIFKSDSITVTLTKDSNSKKLLFVVEAKGQSFDGVANLELIEDNGKFYLPESTSRLDEKTNREYMCDSTFSYQSEKISFVFAMENRTRKRLSFIINNSSVEGIEDNFYTLYRVKQ